MNYPTKKAKEDSLYRLCKARNKLDLHPIIIAWKKYLALSLTEQWKIKKEWEEYYQNVRKTVVFAIFQEQKIALKQRNHARVTELADQVRQMKIDGAIPELQKPTTPDFDLDPVVQIHKSLERQIQELSEFVDYAKNEEQKEVWQGI